VWWYADWLNDRRARRYSKAFLTATAHIATESLLFMGRLASMAFMVIVYMHYKYALETGFDYLLGLLIFYVRYLM
jgi:hypothetical protein